MMQHPRISALHLLTGSGLILILASQLADARLFQGNPDGTSSRTTTTTTTVAQTIRLRPINKLRKPAESCREPLPRKSADLPVLVVVARVKEVYMTPPDQQTTTIIADTSNKALVSVGRVIKGNQQLVGYDIIVSGFNWTTSTSCPNYVKPNDTYIFLLDKVDQQINRYAIVGGQMLSLNLNNLDKINALANDEPFRRRPPIEDILCEAHYCAYGRCVVVGGGSLDTQKPTCQCPNSCPTLPSPVCGSDNTTYTNECHLIKESCRQQRPLFVTKESTC